MKDSIIKTAIKNSLSLFLIELFTEIIQRGVMNVVKIMNNIDKPEIIKNSSIRVKNKYNRYEPVIKPKYPLYFNPLINNQYIQ